jgi:hypothetical protein
MSPSEAFAALGAGYIAVFAIVRGFQLLRDWLR